MISAWPVSPDVAGRGILLRPVADTMLGLLDPAADAADSLLRR